MLKHVADGGSTAGRELQTGYIAGWLRHHEKDAKPPQLMLRAIALALRALLYQEGSGALNSFTPSLSAAPF